MTAGGGTLTHNNKKTDVAKILQDISVSIQIQVFVHKYLIRSLFEPLQSTSSAIDGNPHGSELTVFAISD